MRWSHALIPTLKETPADAVAPSHVLLLRAGMIRQLGPGPIPICRWGCGCCTRPSGSSAKRWMPPGPSSCSCRPFSRSSSGRNRAGSRPSATC